MIEDGTHCIVLAAALAFVQVMRVVNNDAVAVSWAILLCKFLIDQVVFAWHRHKYPQVFRNPRRPSKMLNRRQFFRRAGYRDVERSRLEAFSDGVFAIAATFQFLEIKVPSPDEKPFPSFTDALSEASGDVAAYLISFGVLGLLWMNHHSVVEKLDYVNNVIRLINTQHLVLVSVLPFFFSVLVNFWTDTLALTWASSVIAATGALQLVLWLVARFMHRRQLRAARRARPRPRHRPSSKQLHHHHRHRSSNSGTTSTGSSAGAGFRVAFTAESHRGETAQNAGPLSTNRHRSDGGHVDDSDDDNGNSAAAAARARLSTSTSTSVGGTQGSGGVSLQMERAGAARSSSNDVDNNSDNDSDEDGVGLGLSEGSGKGDVSVLDADYSPPPLMRVEPYDDVRAKFITCRLLVVPLIGTATAVIATYTDRVHLFPFLLTPIAYWVCGYLEARAVEAAVAARNGDEEAVVERLETQPLLLANS